MTPTTGASPSRRPRRRPDGTEAWKRTGLSQGCPSARTPYCSAISRSNRWTCGQSGVSDGKTSASIRRPGEEQGRRVLVGEHGVELHAIAAARAVSRVGEQRRHSPLPAAGLDHELPELAIRQLGDFAHRAPPRHSRPRAPRAGSSPRLRRSPRPRGAATGARRDVQAQARPTWPGARAPATCSECRPGIGTGPSSAPPRPGRPPRTVTPMPMNTTRSRTARPPRRPSDAAPSRHSRMVNSLTNGPKGGEPVMAKNPARNKAPDHGTRRSAPDTSSVYLLP